MTNTTRKCMSCGAEMPAGVWVCPKCRARAVDDQDLFESIFRQSPQENEARRREAEKDPEAELRGQFWRIIVVLSVLAVMIIAAVTVFIVMQHKNDVKQETMSTDTIHLLNEDGQEIDPTEPPQAAGEEQTDEAEDTAATPVPEAEQEELIEVDDIVYVNESGASLRREPTTTAAVLASLARGTELHRTGIQGNWCRVEYEDTVGYISIAVIADEAEELADGVSEEPEEETVTIEEGHDAVEITAEANARTGPGTSYASAAVLEKGTVLERVSVSGNWSCVLVDGQELYVHNNMLRVTDVQTITDTNTSAQEETEEKTEEETVAVSGTGTILSKANVRSGPGTAYSVAGVLDAGETVQITGSSGSWYAVTADDGTEGYVAAGMMNVQVTG